jgi:ribosomal-protein-alanine N-acetyltransferase
MKIIIKTERLILRKILPSDEAGLFELDSNPDVHNYLGKNQVTDTEQIKMAIKIIRQQYVDHGIGRLAIIEKITNEFIGWAELKLVKDKTNNYIDYYDVGYRLIQKYWGKGIATETTLSTLEYGFNNLNEKEIYGMCDIENRGSAALFN